MLKSIEISSTNILFKSDEEQITIIENFCKFLDTIDSPIQILFSSSKYVIKDKKMKIQNDEYDKFLKKIILKNNILQRDFKLILYHNDEDYLNNQIEMIKIYFKQCGLMCDNIKEEKSENYIPEHMNRKYVKFNKKYYETFYIHDYPRYSYCGWLHEIYNSDIDCDISMNICPSQNHESVKYLEQKAALNVANSSIDEDNDKFSDQYDENIDSAMSMRDEIFKNEGKMFFISLYITVKGKTLQELKKNRQLIKMITTGKGIKLYSCYLRQDDGYRCTRPINNDLLNKKYNITTKSLKYFFPFLSSHIIDKDGVLIGKNLLTPGLIFLNPFIYNSALMFVLGKVGGGKTYTIQLLVLRLAYMGVKIDIWDKTKFEYYNLLKLVNLDNIKVHSYDTIEEYENHIENYVRDMNNNLNKLEQRFLIIDEGHYFTKNSQKICDNINIISLTGRKFFQGLCFITQMIEHISDENILSVLRQASIKILMQMEVNSAKVVQKELDLTDNEVRFLASANQEGILIAGSKRVQFKAMASEKEDKIITTDPSKRIINMKRGEAV